MLYFFITSFSIIINFFCFYYIKISFYFFLGLIFIISFIFLSIFNKLIIWYQFLIKIYSFSFLNISYILGFDGLSLCLTCITVFIILLSFISFRYMKYLSKLYIGLLFFSLFCLINVFCVMDFFYFLTFSESVVIPMFFLIGIWGSRVRRIYASHQLFIYTLIGSIFILRCFIIIYLNIGSSLIEFYLQYTFFCKREFLFWILLFAGFAIKIPTIPFHIWLPEAHVEAPTPGSVILAALILKLGSYAMFRFLFQSMIYVGNELMFFLLDLSLLGLLYGSLAALNQIDFKKIVAYSSIAHMNFLLIGLFSQSLFGLTGAFLLMFGHAFTSGAFFFSLGVLYDRYKTRLIFYYGGFVVLMPILSLILFIICLSNFGFPGTFNFVGEFLILVGNFKSSIVIMFFVAISLI